MNSSETLVLTPREIQNLLTLDDCIEVVERAFRLYGNGAASPPAVLSMHTEGGGFHVKTGILDLERLYFAAKVNGNFADNANRFGLPTIQGVIVLCDADNGTPLAIMDSRHVTSLRTGAATAVAAKYLARHDSQVVTICGCGNQGRVQLRALCCMRQIKTAFAYDRSEEQASRFVREMISELKIKVIPATDLASAIRQSDVCVTCTTSQEPFLGPNEVPPGIFVAAVGADNPHKHEIQSSLMARSKIVCDVLEQCAAMGDLHHALDAGVVSREDVHAELGAIVAGRKAGRQSDDEVIIFDSTAWHYKTWRRPPYCMRKLRSRDAACG